MGKAPRVGWAARECLRSESSEHQLSLASAVLSSCGLVDSVVRVAGAARGVTLAYVR